MIFYPANLTPIMWKTIQLPHLTLDSWDRQHKENKGRKVQLHPLWYDMKMAKLFLGWKAKTRTKIQPLVLLEMHINGISLSLYLWGWSYFRIQSQFYPHCYFLVLFFMEAICVCVFNNQTKLSKMHVRWFWFWFNIKSGGIWCHRVIDAFLISPTHEKCY